MVDLSVSIVNYNNKEYLESCLNSIYSNHLKIDFEVIVVDNGSSDGSVEMTKQVFPSVTLIENSRNEGFVIANNKGVRASQGRYILSLNNDTVILDDVLDTLVEFMDKHPEAGVCGPKVLNNDGTIQHQCKRGFPTVSSLLYYYLGLHKIFPKSKIFGHYLKTYLKTDEVNEVDSVSGACLMVRREVIKEVGLLDENFIMYGDDLDWCYRIKKAGWKVYYVPHAQIVHYGGRSSRKLPYKSIKWFYRAAAVFYKKHYAPSNNFIVNYIVYSGIFIKALLALTINFLKKEKIVGSKKP
jgi:hypothetical protein